MMKKRHLEMLGYHVLQVSRKITHNSDDKSVVLLITRVPTDSSLRMELNGAFHRRCMERISEEENILRVTPRHYLETIDIRLFADCLVQSYLNRSFCNK